MDIDTKLVKKSHERLIISGNQVEHFCYSKPYFWNFPPIRKNEGRLWGTNQERRSDNLNRTRAYLARLIKANEDAYAERPKFVTYTFADNVTSVEDAMVVWRKFSRRLSLRFGGLKYVSVIEFQKRGAVHFHVLYFNMPYVRGLKKVLFEEWREGFIKVKAIGKIDNVGLYVSKYLSKEHADERLVTRKAFFCSRGLVKPEEFREPANISTVYSFLDPTMVLKSTKTYQSHYFGTVKQNIYEVIVSGASPHSRSRTEEFHQRSKQGRRIRGG